MRFRPRETLTFYRAHGAHRVAEGGGDETEDITVHLVPLRGLPAWLDARSAVTDMKLYAGLYMAGFGRD